MLPTFNDDRALSCPACTHHYLHHSAVEVYLRDEDADSGLRVTAFSESGGESEGHPHAHFALTTRDIAANPSPRRDGLRIKLWCEGCGAANSLVLYQHKGRTYVEWEAPK